MKSTQALEKARYELVSALFINFKIEENTILRSTYDEILKPLEIKEIKHFMLLLAKTERNYRSTLELVGDVAAKIIYNRVDTRALSQLSKTLETKFQAVLVLASKAITHSDYINEAAFLEHASPQKFQNRDASPLFTPEELDIISRIGFFTLAKLAMEDNYLFHQRIVQAATVKMTGVALPVAPTQTLLAPSHE